MKYAAMDKRIAAVLAVSLQTWLIEFISRDLAGHYILRNRPFKEIIEKLNSVSVSI